jgi:hypothetical protein
MELGSIPRQEIPLGSGITISTIIVPNYSLAMNTLRKNGGYDDCAWSCYPNISELDIGSGLNELIKILLLINRWKCPGKSSLIHLFKLTLLISPTY